MEKAEINNPFEEEIPSKLIEKNFKSAVAFFRKKGIIKKDCNFELSFALVDAKRIAQLNRQYRGKNESTDVLSFCYENSGEKINGEIILCLREIEENARSDKTEIEEELAKNIIHGILHVIGFEHGPEMFSLEKEASSSF